MMIPIRWAEAAVQAVVAVPLAALREARAVRPRAELLQVEECLPAAELRAELEGRRAVLPGVRAEPAACRAVELRAVPVEVLVQEKILTPPSAT